MGIKDKCVLCGEKTPCDVASPVEDRTGYVEGAGQLCEHCHKKLYK